MFKEVFRKTGVSLFGAYVIYWCQGLTLGFYVYNYESTFWIWDSFKDVEVKIVVKEDAHSGTSTGEATKYSWIPSFGSQHISLSFEQWTSCRKNIAYFLVFNHRIISRLFVVLDSPVAFKEQITNSSAKAFWQVKGVQSIYFMLVRVQCLLSSSFEVPVTNDCTLYTRDWNILSNHWQRPNPPPTSFPRHLKWSLCLLFLFYFCAETGYFWFKTAKEIFHSFFKTW